MNQLEVENLPTKTKDRGRKKLNKDYQGFWFVFKAR
jgi:hypothetical protein